MGSVPINPSAAVARLLRRSRLARKLSLEEVSQRLAERGHRIPTTTLGRIERGAADPGVRRLHLLLDLYGIRPDRVADVVELERLADEAKTEIPVDADLHQLHEQGIEHWRAGRVAEGLAYLIAVREMVTDSEEMVVLRQKTTLAFATAARNLGKYALAHNVVEELLLEPADPSLTVRVLVLASSCWRGLGSLDAALGMIRQAEAKLRPGQAVEHAWVAHQKARLLFESNEIDDADAALEEAVRAYRELGDSYGEVRALALRIRIREAQGDEDGAREVAQSVIRQSEANSHERGTLYGHLELGRLLLKKGRFEEAAQRLDLAVAEAIRLNDRNAQFVAHYHRWKLNAELGDARLAEIELKSAQYFSDFVDEHTPELAEIRRLTVD